MNVSFFPYTFTPSDAEKKRLDGIQNYIKEARASIQNECRSMANSQYWFMLRVEQLANQMRSRFFVIQGDGHRSTYQSEKIASN